MKLHQGIFTGALILLPGCSNFGENHDDDFDALQSYITENFEKINKKVDDLKSKVDNLKSKINDVESKIEDMDTKIEDIKLHFSIL